MSSKVAVVTGANKGIGLEIVRGLCKRFNGIVYLTSRDESRGLKAIAELKQDGLKPEFHQLDISNPKSVEIFRDHLKTKYGGLDLLVNNAAIAFKSNASEPRAVQAKETLAVNYFAVLSTCEILFPLLRNGARVVNVSSSAGHLSKIPSAELKSKLKDPNLTIDQLTDLMNQYIEAATKGNVDGWGNSSYAVSKVGLSALTRIQQRMLNDKDIKVNAVHPGYVATDMSSHMGTLSVEEGASAPLWLALDAPDTLRGAYVWADSKIYDWEADSPVEKL